MSGFDPPSVLVLGGGGILGEAWMSAVLAGLADRSDFDPLGCDHYVGTSAGSIVAAALASGIDPRVRLGDLPEQPAPAGVDEAGASGLAARALGASRVALGPLAALGLRSTAPGGALLRRLALARVTPGRRSLAEVRAVVDGWDATWDGRLLIAAVDVGSGRRVVFGQEGAPRPPLGDAIEASCAIPGFFRPIEIEGRSYVDGGVWSPTSMDAAPAGRGTRVLCLNPTANLRPTRGNPYGALGLVSRALAAIEATALRRRGVDVTLVVPDAASTAAMGGRLMDEARRQDTLAAGLAQGRALAGSRPRAAA